MTRSPLIVGGALMVFVCGLDQWTKHLILTYFAAGHDPLMVTSFWDLVLAFNRGVSFSLFSQESQAGVYALIGITLVVTVGLFYWMTRAHTLALGVGLGLMIGGSLGNIIDRIQFGAVVDFLHFHWQNYSFPAFNIADSGITLGVGFILLDSLLEWRKVPPSNGEQN